MAKDNYGKCFDDSPSEGSTRKVYTPAKSVKTPVDKELGNHEVVGSDKKQPLFDN